ncbi:MAG TPA: hypothetical protein ENK57_07150 [Polyangiaceae bacterium]|nr:hypothetical protein [Polyangiaceae bacterium]
MARVLGSRLTALLFIGIVGCGGGCGSSPPPSRERPAAPETPAAQAEEPDPAPEAAPVDPGPPPVLRVTGVPDAHDRSVVIRIENRGTDAAELDAELTLQRASGEGWVDVHAQLALRYSCEDEVPECVTLAPGGAYLPPPWLGTTAPGTAVPGTAVPGAAAPGAAAQCECEGCPPAPPGTYRLVVRSCNGAHTATGAEFTIR